MKKDEKIPASARGDGISFIRNEAKRKAQALHNSGAALPEVSGAEAKTSVVPVMAVTKSFLLWNKVKWPLLAASIVVLFIILGAVAYNIFVEREIDKVLALAKFNEYTGEIDHLESAEKMIAELHGEYPGRDRVNTAYAWQLLLRSEIFGPRKVLHQKIRQLIENGVTGGNEEALLGKAVLLHLDKKYSDCIKAADEALGRYPEAARLALLKTFALAETAKVKEVLDFTKASKVKHSDYTPLVLFAIKTASEKGTGYQSLRWTRKLLSISPNHIYGKLMLIEARLPNWGAFVIDDQKFIALRKETRFLEKQYANGSPFIAQFGRFLEGRFAFHKDNLEKARTIFHSVVKENPEPRYVAWLGQTIYDMEGPDAALGMLSTHPNLKSQELWQLRATCLLSHHRVHQAEKIVKEMQAAVDYRATRSAKRVEWLLATRKGSLKKALELLPEIIRQPYQWTALELYWQLKAIGDGEGVKKVIESLGKTFSACARTMEAWHEKRAKKVVQIHTSPNSEAKSCISALAAHSLRTFVPVAKVEKAVKLAAKEAKSENAWLETDRAIVEWMQRGQRAAEKILDDLLARKPEGNPLKYQIARAFLRIDLAQRAHDLVASCDTPEGIDICIDAQRKLGRDKRANALVKKAVAMSSRTNHPALYPYKLKENLGNKPRDSALDEAKMLSKQSGAWTVKSVELYVDALAKRGELDAVELYLHRLPRAIAVSSGQDMAWRIREFAVRYNISRGKRFLSRARDIIDRMDDANVHSARFLYSRGISRLVRNNAKMAERWFRQSLDYDPTFLPAYRRLSRIGKLEPKMKVKLASCYPSLNLKKLR